MNLASASDNVNSMGLCNDGYDYSQHMRVMGGGVFVSNSGKVVSQQKPPATTEPSILELPRDVLPSEVEIDRHLESITISEKVMGGDMRAIIGGWHEEFEELDDDFVIQAAADGGDVEEFDYDAHIARIMAESERAEGLGPWAEDENEVADGEECDAEEVEMRQHGERSFLEAQFEATLADYDDDEDDEWREGLGNEEGDPEWKLKDNDYVQQCLNEFLETGDDRIRRPLEIDKETMDATRRQVMAFSTQNAEATTTIQDEWKLMEKSFGYLKPREHQNWDCESVLTTCSTTENLPTTISVQGRERRTDGNGDTTMIRLSKKTGLPVHETIIDAPAQQHRLTPNDELDENAIVCNNKGKARQRGESAEDRRTRKLAVKEYQRMRRKEKLALKNASKEGVKAAQQQLANSESASARSVYVYS